MTLERQQGGLGQITQGAGYLLDGARMLFREPRLWLLAAVPMLLSLAAFSTAIGLLIGNASDLHTLATGWLPQVEAGSWYTWLWIAPALVLLKALGWLMFLGLALVCLLVAYLVASLLAAPFHDLLAARDEMILTGGVRDDNPAGLLGTFAGVSRSLLQELQRLLFFMAVVGPLAIAGLLVPGAQLLTGPLIVAFSVLFLPLDYASYTLDRRLLTFRQKRRWVFERIPTMVGFGGAAFLTCVVPGLNFIAMPLLVIAGTLLSLRLPPDEFEGNGDLGAKGGG